MIFCFKYIIFDCYGMFMCFCMGEMMCELFVDCIMVEQMEQFIVDFIVYCFDEVLGDWKLYEVVLKNVVCCLCKKWKIQYFDIDGQVYYDVVLMWDLYVDVLVGLVKVVKEILLVILFNVDDLQIQKNVVMFGVLFYCVYMVQQVQVYKLCLKVFEYMFDLLGCNLEDVLYVLFSLCYDLMLVDDFGIVNKVFVNCGYGFGNLVYCYIEIQDIGGLFGVVGF